MTALPLLKLTSDYVAFHADKTPDTLFLWCSDGSYNYQQSRTLVDDCAAKLLTLGINKGDRVAWYGNPTPACFLHFLATGSIGAIWTGLNPKYTRTELEYVLGDAQPAFIFAQVSATKEDRADELIELAAACNAKLISFGVEQSLKTEFEAYCAPQGEADSSAIANTLAQRREQIDTHDPAFIVYTSGSTGKPKGALLSHYGENFCNIIAVERKGLAGRKMICNLPINHVGAISDICGRAMTGGGSLYFQEHFNPVAMMQLIEQEKIDTWGAVPAVFQICANAAEFDDVDLSSVELIAWGGARMPQDLIRNLVKKTGATQFTMGYGMTETVGGVTYCRLDDNLEVLSETIGTPDPRQPIRLWHEEERAACPGERGEIQVKGDFVMCGYWRREQATQEAFTEDGWMKTGDVAIVRPDGNLEIVGRLSEMFKSGGYNVYPREIELALEENENVALAAVVSRPDPTFQEVGHAFVMMESGRSISNEELKTFLKDRLANYKIPKSITQLEALPMLPIGKVDKKELKNIAAMDG